MDNNILTALQNALKSEARYFPQTTADNTLAFLRNADNYSFLNLLAANAAQLGAFVYFDPNDIGSSSLPKQYKELYANPFNTTGYKQYIHNKYLAVQRYMQTLANIAGIKVDGSYLTVDGYAGRKTLTATASLAKQFVDILKTATGSQLIVSPSQQMPIAVNNTMLVVSNKFVAYAFIISLLARMELLWQLRQLGLSDISAVNNQEQLAKIDQQLTAFYKSVEALPKIDESALQKFINDRLNFYTGKLHVILRTNNLYVIDVDRLLRATQLNADKLLDAPAAAAQQYISSVAGRGQSGQSSQTGQSGQTGQSSQSGQQSQSGQSGQTSGQTQQQQGGTGSQTGGQKQSTGTGTTGGTAGTDNKTVDINLGSRGKIITEKFINQFKTFKALHEQQIKELEQKYQSTGLLEQYKSAIVNISDEPLEQFKKVLLYLMGFSSNALTQGGISVKQDMQQLYLTLRMLIGVVQSLVETIRIAPRQVLEFHIVKDPDFTNTSVPYQDTYYYPIVLSFNVTREAWNPVDVAFVTIPSFNPNLQIPGFNQYAGGMYMSIDQLVQEGMDVSLYVGYGRERRELVRVFSGFIRQAQRNNDGTVTLICEGYGQHLIRPIVRHTNAEGGILNDPRKIVFEAIRDTNSWHLGVLQTTVADQLNKYKVQLLTQIEAQRAQVQDDIKQQAAIDTYRALQHDVMALSVLRSAPFAENIFYCDSYWPGLRTPKTNETKAADFWDALERMFNIVKLSAGYSAWDIIYDMCSLTSDFIQAVEPIDPIAQARVFFGKPEFPFVYQYKPSVAKPELSMQFQAQREQLQKATDHAQKTWGTLADQLQKVAKYFYVYHDLKDTGQRLQAVNASQPFALGVLSQYFWLLDTQLASKYLDFDRKAQTQAVSAEFSALLQSKDVKQLIDNTYQLLDTFNKQIGVQIAELLKRQTSLETSQLVAEMVQVIAGSSSTSQAQTIKNNVKRVAGGVWYTINMQYSLHLYRNAIGNQRQKLYSNGFLGLYALYNCPGDCTKYIDNAYQQVVGRFQLMDSMLQSRYGELNLLSGQPHTNFRMDAFMKFLEQRYTHKALFDKLIDIVTSLPAAMSLFYQNFDKSVLDPSAVKNMDAKIVSAQTAYKKAIVDESSRLSGKKLTDAELKNVKQKIDNEQNKLVNAITEAGNQLFNEQVAILKKHFDSISAQSVNVNQIINQLQKSQNLVYGQQKQLAVCYSEKEQIVTLFSEHNPMQAIFRRQWLQFLVNSFAKQLCPQVLVGSKDDCANVYVSKSYFELQNVFFKAENVLKALNTLEAMYKDVTAATFDKVTGYLKDKADVLDLLRKTVLANKESIRLLKELVSGVQTQLQKISKSSDQSVVVNVQQNAKQTLARLFDQKSTPPSKAELQQIAINMNKDFLWFDVEKTTITKSQANAWYFDAIASLARTLDNLYFFSSNQSKTIDKADDVVLETVYYQLAHNKQLVSADLKGNSVQLQTVQQLDINDFEYLKKTFAYAFNFLSNSNYKPANNLNASDKLELTKQELYYCTFDLSCNFASQLYTAIVERLRRAYSGTQNVLDTKLTTVRSQILRQMLKVYSSGLETITGEVERTIFNEFERNFDHYLTVLLRSPASVPIKLYQFFQPRFFVETEPQKDAGSLLKTTPATLVRLQREGRVLPFAVANLNAQFKDVQDWLLRQADYDIFETRLYRFAAPVGQMRLQAFQLQSQISRRLVIQKQPDGSYSFMPPAEIRSRAREFANDLTSINGQLNYPVFLKEDWLIGFEQYTGQYINRNTQALQVNVQNVLQTQKEDDFLAEASKILQHSFLIGQLQQDIQAILQRFRMQFFVQQQTIYLVMDSKMQLDDMDAFDAVTNSIGNYPIEQFVRAFNKQAQNLYVKQASLYYYSLQATTTELSYQLKHAVEQTQDAFDAAVQFAFNVTTDKQGGLQSIQQQSYSDLLDELQQAERSIQLMFSKNVLENASDYMFERSKLIRWSKRNEYFSDVGRKVYPLGTRPFASYHYIYTNMIVRNEIGLNNKVVNHVVLYQPTMLGAIPIIGKVLDWFAEMQSTFTASSKTVDMDGNKFTVTEQYADDNIPTSLLNTKTVQTLAQSIPQMRILAQTFHLKRGLQDMYTGQLIIVGTPSIKPFDYVYIEDKINDMFGIQQVKAVNHIYSPELGFVTSLQLMPVIVTRDVHVSVQAYTATKLLDITITSIIMGGQIAATISTGGLAGGLIQGVGAATKQLSKKVFFQQLIRNIAKTLGVDSFITDIAGVLASTNNVAEGKAELIALDKVVQPLVITVLKKNGMPFMQGLTNQQYNKHSIKEVFTQRFETIRLATQYVASFVRNLTQFSSDIAQLLSLLNF